MRTTKKPTRNQLKTALEVQAPSKPAIHQRSTQRRTLLQAGVGFDDSLEFYRVDDWFESSEEIESLAFDILSANTATNKQGRAKVIFKLKRLDDGEISLCSLPQNETRLKFVAAFKADTTPIGPCHFVKFDSGKGLPYMDIQMVGDVQMTDDELPF